LKPQDLEVQFLEGRNRRLTAPLRFESKTGAIIEVPAGFVTDLASIPRPLWAIFPPDGNYAPAAVIHDWLYRNNALHSFNRGQCDGFLLEGMEQLGVNWFKRKIIWSGVRVGGWAATDV
jgi:hypothetical protein